MKKNPAAPKNPLRRNQSIDLIKIFAMIGVMGLHSGLGKADSFMVFLISRVFGISVPLFFMVSGYLLSTKDVDWEYCRRKIIGIARFCFLMCFFYWLIFDLVKGSWPTEVVWDFMGGFFQHGHLWMFWYFGAMIIIYLLLPRFQNVMFSKKVLWGLFFFVSITFCLNLLWGFEERFVNQTLRIWNWLFFFGIGGYLSKSKRFGHSAKVKHKYISLMEIGGASSLFVLFSYIMYEKLPGIEYYFGSLFCIIYAICLFVCVIQLPIKDNKLISVLANLFLPVYALHMEVKTMLSFVDTTICGSASPLADFIILSTVTLLVSWLLMRIPIAKKIFKI